MPPSRCPDFEPRDFISLGLWASMFLFEIIADNQKSAWKAAKLRKEHDEQFITKGLWAISRHPKFVLLCRQTCNSLNKVRLPSSYVGEFGLWTGLSALSLPALRSGYYPAWTPMLAAISPLFTYYLLRNVSLFLFPLFVEGSLSSQVSGVPPLEVSNLVFIVSVRIELRFRGRARKNGVQIPSGRSIRGSCTLIHGCWKLMY